MASMEFSFSLALCRLPNTSSSSSPSIPPASLSTRSLPSRLNLNLNLNLRRKNFFIRSISTQAAPASGGLAPAIALTDNALEHLNKMRSERSEDLCLRIGVKQGGCSGMSYTMEFESKENARPDDTVMEYNGFVIGLIHDGSSMGMHQYVFLGDHTTKSNLSQVENLHCNNDFTLWGSQCVIQRAFFSFSGCNWTSVMHSSEEVFHSKTQMLHKHVAVVSHLLQRCRRNVLIFLLIHNSCKDSLWVSCSLIMDK